MQWLELEVQTLREGLAVTGEAADPVFVVGASPDERALLQPMLDAHRNISCQPETDLLAGLTLVKESLPGLAPQSYPDQCRSAAEYYATLELDNAASRGKDRWVELVDTTTLRPKKLDRLFPTCRIVHVVGSGWNARGSAHAIRIFAAGIRAERYCEVEAMELVTNPEWAVRRILGFIGETWDPVVLQAGHGLAQAA